MNLKELKAKKRIKVTRIDHNYSTDEEKIQQFKDYCKEKGLYIKSEQPKDGWIYYKLVDANIDKITWFNLMLNNKHKQKILNGVIEFRSKDYIFRYEVDGEQHAIYGDSIKASNIQGNKLIFDYGIEYTLEV